MKIQQTDTSRVFFTSDPHFGHKNICAGVTSWVNSWPIPYHDWSDDVDYHADDAGLYFSRTAWVRSMGLRDFPTLEAMNDALVERFNETVGEDDHLFIIGDVAFGSKENIGIFLRQIRCKNKYLVYGNHDQHIRKNKDGEQGYFKWCRERAQLTVDGQTMILDHFAGRVWDHSGHGAWQLYGHSHGSLPDDPTLLSMDVGVDTNDLRPYSFDEIKLIMSKKTPQAVDHHRGLR